VTVRASVPVDAPRTDPRSIGVPEVDDVVVIVVVVIVIVVVFVFAHFVLADTVVYVVVIRRRRDEREKEEYRRFLVPASGCHPLRAEGPQRPARAGRTARQ
jgi:hypothetical protein